MWCKIPCEAQIHALEQSIDLGIVEGGECPRDRLHRRKIGLQKDVMVKIVQIAADLGKEPAGTIREPEVVVVGLFQRQRGIADLPGRRALVDAIGEELDHLWRPTRRMVRCWSKAVFETGLQIRVYLQTAKNINNPVSGSQRRIRSEANSPRPLSPCVRGFLRCCAPLCRSFRA